MESEKSKNKKTGVKKIVLLFVVIAAIILGIFAVAGKTLKSDKIYQGVNVGGREIGGMSKKEAEKAVDDYFKSNSDFTLKFNCDGERFDVLSKDISVKPKTSDAVKKAYSAGRNHGAFKNYTDIMSFKRKGYTVPLEISYDKDRLLILVNDKISDKIKDPTPMNVEVGKDCIYITNSIAGEGINSEKLFKEVEKTIIKKSFDKEISLSVEKIKPSNPSFDEFSKKYLRDAKDAVYTKNDDGFVIEPEVVGISFDKKEAERIFKANKNNTETYEIPAVITAPAVTAKMLEDKYVNKIISSYSTNFGGSSANRCSNIALAASKINGYVINPGKRFSYNGVVGPRTEGAGFKAAHVYVGTEVVDGIGGGICQVSSTLYNAAVLADMKIVSRTNHSMPVGYVPLGRDATVSYGSIDFVFENDKPYPVSIKASVSGATLTVSIVGTKEEDYNISFITEGAKTVGYSTIKVEDANLPEGQTKVLSRGTNGSVVNSYRVYTRNGKEYQRKFEAKSTYSPTPEKIAVGTKKETVNAEQTAPQTPEQNTQPPQTVQESTPTEAERGEPDIPTPQPVEPPLLPANSEEESDPLDI